ncbi:MAG: hypothetical protein ACRC7O_13830 [Fimbriiglobus sp.]
MTADVRSIGVLREWLAAIGVYRSEIDESLSAARQEARRGIDWVAEQTTMWSRAVREREEDVHKAKMDLSAKKVPGPTGKEPDTTLEVKALRRARERLEHAEDQVRRCRAWHVDLQKLVDESFAAPAHRLQAFLDGDLERGREGVAKQADALERYADLKSDIGGGQS